MRLFEAPLLVAGEFEAPADQWVESYNPANEKLIGRYIAASARDVDRAVRASLQAQEAWWDLSKAERSDAIVRFADALLARQDEIARLEALDTGNTVGRLAKDVEIAAANLKYFASISMGLAGEAESPGSGGLHLSLRLPYGVVGRIVPFNHPFMFAAARIAAPLAAGNAVIIKTPEQSPLSSRIIGEEARRFFPPGLVSIIHGAGQVAGDALVRHPLVKRIGFTGSVPTGQLIQKAAAEAGIKHVSLELGGKNPLIAMPDMPPTLIAQRIVEGMNFRWSGQSCGSTSRAFVHESQYDEVVQLVAERIDSLVIGDPLSPSSDMGPVNSRPQLEKVERYIRWAKEDGARLVAGGHRPEGEAFAKGFWIRPTAFADVEMTMRLAREEVFGPVLAILKWRTEAQLVEMANSVEYGLTAAIWTNDLSAALRLSKKIDSGYVWINGGSAHFVGMPFAGRKASGVGSEEGFEELLSYTETKAVHFL